MTRKSNRGFSIVEILIALTVLVIFLVPIIASLITGMKTTTSAKETQYRNEYARNLMEHVKEMPISVLNNQDAAKSYFESLGANINDVTITSNVFDKYEIKGTTNIGTQNTQYAYAIEISGEGYESVNDRTFGFVEDLDQSKVALISAPFANYDYPAYDALLTKKMTQLPNNTTDDVAKFNNDTCTRNINIKVEKIGGNYKVTCTLTYTDNALTSGVAPVTVDYVPYCQTFEKLPNIYLMYNSCVYNDKYAKDNITFQLNDVQEDVKVFMIANPADDSYRTATEETRQVEINNTLDNMYIYHNFAELDDLTVKFDNEDKIGSLNDVLDGRGLYQVKIWMQKGSIDDIDTTNIDPVLQGTRGGDEIE